MTMKLPNDGGCWFCHTDNQPLVFDCEFDTFVHLTCLQRALAMNPNDPEAQIMSYLLLLTDW